MQQSTLTVNRIHTQTSWSHFWDNVKSTQTFVTLSENGNLHSQTSWSHFWDKSWRMLLCIVHTLGTWKHKQTQKWVTFLGHSGKYYYAIVTLLGRGSIHTHKSWSHFWDKFWKIHTYIGHTVGPWEHIHTKKLDTFLGQLL